MNKNKNKSLILTIIAIIILFIVTVVTSYAAFYYSKVGNEVNKVTTGTITMSYSENNNGIYLTNASPMNDSVGMALSNNNEYFDFTVASTVSGSTTIDYAIVGVKDRSSTLPDEGVKVYLTSLDGNGENQVVRPTKVSELKSTDTLSYTPNNQYLIYQNNFRETSAHNYRLRMWVDSDYVLPDESLTYLMRINVYGNMSS